MEDGQGVHQNIPHSLSSLCLELRGAQVRFRGGGIFFVRAEEVRSWGSVNTSDVPDAIARLGSKWSVVG